MNSLEYIPVMRADDMLKSIRFKTKKVNIVLRFEFEKSTPYFVYVGSKHHKDFFLNIFCVCATLIWAYRDWMIKTDEIIVLEDGRKFDTYSKNPEYMDEEITVIEIPKVD